MRGFTAPQRRTTYYKACVPLYIQWLYTVQDQNRIEKLTTLAQIGLDWPLKSANACTLQPIHLTIWLQVNHDIWYFFEKKDKKIPETFILPIWLWTQVPVNDDCRDLNNHTNFQDQMIINDYFYICNGFLH